MGKVSTAQTVGNKAKKSGDNQYRLNIGLNPEAKSELEHLSTLTKKGSMVEVIRSALTIYKVVVEHTQSGGKVIFRHSDGTEETLRFI